MKALAAAVFLTCTWPAAVWPQTKSVPASETPAIVPSSAASPEVEQRDTRFGALGEEAERLHLIWQKASDDNLAYVERLLRSKVCQTPRIGPVLERTQKALDDYLTAAKKYWEIWGIAENKRVDDQRKQLASMETDLERTKQLQDEEKKGRETLDQKEAALEQSARTEDVRKQIEEVKKDIIESETSLDEARRRFESLTVDVTAMNDSILARVMNINQNSARLEAFGLEQKSVYDDKRKEAQAVCSTSKPGLRTPPQKKAPNP
jgi:chromosome segregation ATPase